MRILTIVLVAFVSVTSGYDYAYQEDPCASKGGTCVDKSCCPYSNYISGQCPSQSASIKCCYSTPTCPYNEDPCQSEGSKCHYDSCCPNGNYAYGKCPSQGSDVLCCKSEPACGSGGGGDGTCGEVVQDLACQILYHDSVYLLSINPSGIADGADPLTNIQDTCNGNQALRSSYCCSSGCSPGGSVCLKQSVLQYILDVLNSAASPSNRLQINAIAGACHSSTSWHYQGTSVDFQVSSSSNYRTWMSMCSTAGARENLGPGDAGHSTHTHCAFSS